MKMVKVKEILNRHLAVLTTIKNPNLINISMI